MKTPKLTNRGFTLVELLTAVSIFAIVMVISMGSVLGIFDANRKTRSLKTVMTNLNLALESMSKEVRFGQNYHCNGQVTGTITTPRNCASGDTLLSFLSNEGDQVTYRLSNQTIEKRINSEDFIAVTAPELVVDDLDFYVLGAGTGNTLQPKVIVRIKSHAGTGRSRSDFTLQTLLSQREPDI